jgi:hypothetical protein
MKKNQRSKISCHVPFKKKYNFWEIDHEENSKNPHLFTHILVTQCTFKRHFRRKKLKKYPGRYKFWYFGTSFVGTVRH